MVRNFLVLIHLLTQQKDLSTRVGQDLATGKGTLCIFKEKTEMIAIDRETVGPCPTVS
ncbi:MAG: hypothetical protein JW882_10405 [Deltaproteobacteria bacterium]|nr:hypothetical protein [Deltaproteobacteria bacterium]